MLLNVRLEGSDHVGELQLHLKTIIDIKEAAHRTYALMRSVGWQDDSLKDEQDEEEEEEEAGQRLRLPLPAPGPILSARAYSFRVHALLSWHTPQNGGVSIGRGQCAARGLRRHALVHLHRLQGA